MSLHEQITTQQKWEEQLVRFKQWTTDLAVQIVGEVVI